MQGLSTVAARGRGIATAKEKREEGCSARVDFDWLERIKPECSGHAAEIVGKRVTFNAKMKRYQH